MLANADITLYHKEYDPMQRTDVWRRSQWPGCNWYGGRSVTVSDGGLDASGQRSDVYKVRIPTGQAVQAAPGDIVVRGLFEDERPQEARRKAAESFVVTAVRDDRRGSAPLHHWKLEGM